MQAWCTAHPVMTFLLAWVLIGGLFGTREIVVRRGR